MRRLRSALLPFLSSLMALQMFCKFKTKMERAVVLGRLRKSLEFPPEFHLHPQAHILKPLLQAPFPLAFCLPIEFIPLICPSSI